MSTIYDKLKAYSDSDYYGFHMPGHKRTFQMSWDVNPYAVDITEIEGFDDLHHAEGILKEAQERAARVFHADETHFLVNGSTVGILSAIAGVTKKGDSILVARNCHKSVYHAIYMNELNPVYLYPGFDEKLQLNMEISAEDVRRALKRYPQIRAVVIVSPTYDGVVSDVAAIAEAAHEMGLPLIVDEAHGAHFGFHPYFPKNANQKGADIVIQSVHKTLPSLTQTALLHMNGTIVDRRSVRRYLGMLQSSSPSYILMASIDKCVDLLDHHCEEVFDPYVERLTKTRERLAGLRKLRLVEPTPCSGGGCDGQGYNSGDCAGRDYDRSKIIISTGDLGMTGKQLSALLLHEYHLQMEMAAGTYVLAMTSIGDTPEGMERLVDALTRIENEAEVSRSRKLRGIGRLPEAQVIYSIAEMTAMQDMAESKAEKRSWKDANGYISLEYAYLYPPGIPIIAPGERITENVTDMLYWYQERGFDIEGLKEEGHIEVWMHG